MDWEMQNDGHAVICGEGNMKRILMLGIAELYGVSMPCYHMHFVAG